ncbi:MAG: chemotaxis protein CheW [Acidobacteriia bacterium]|nr:chemotaxis protein CheW [Terriglobia bacterium]
MRPKPVIAPQGAREDVIVFTVGGFSFAISAYAVSEIRSLEGLQPFSPGPECQCPEKVNFTMHRNGALYFVVDAARQFGLPATRPGRVLILRLAATAVLVDSADRMAEISVLHALPLAFNGDERRWYRGLAMFGEDVVPVVNHQTFLSSSELAVARSAAVYAKGVAVV